MDAEEFISRTGARVESIEDDLNLVGIRHYTHCHVLIGERDPGQSLLFLTAAEQVLDQIGHL